MANCKLCKKSVPDGVEYCDDCLDKKQQTDESYLDSLLNSVKNTSEPILKNYKKSQEPKKAETDQANESKDEDFANHIDPMDLADFEQFDLSKDLGDIIIIGDEELYGQVEDFIDEDTASSAEDKKIHNTQDLLVQDMEDSFMGLEQQEEEAPLEDGVEEEQEAGSPFEDWAGENQEAEAEEALQDNASEEPGADASTQGIQDNVDLDFLDMFSNPSAEEEENYDPSLGELLSGFGLPEEKHSSAEAAPDSGFGSADETPAVEEKQGKQTEEEEFLSLLGQFATDDPVAEDMQAIAELLSKPASDNTPSDVGDVFSDALTVVTGLEDPEEEKPRKRKKFVPEVKDEPDNKKAKTTKGKGLFSKLFGNVVDEKAIKEAKQSKAAEEAAAAKDKKKGKKKGKKASSENIEEVQEAPKRRPSDEEAAEEPKPKKKKEKKPKKQKKKSIELIDDYEEIEGRINRLGATVIFTFFGTITALLLIGTSLFTYSVSIRNAKTYFERRDYTEAYNEVYGMELRDEDIELYDRIMTVMFVNKQLNSYNNYFAMGKYPEALDSLMKGLKRYDKYINLATMLGIKSDLDYVRDQIMGELEHVYRLSEQEIDDILNKKSQKEYSIAIYNAVIENMNY